MERRSIAALVLVVYSVILINVVVFKDAIGVAEWTREGRGERVEGVRAGRGRGGPRNVGGTEGRTGGRMARGPSAVADARLSTSRFAPLHANYVPFKTILPQLRGRPTWASAMINLFGNTILFMPIGFLVSIVYEKMRWHKALVLAVALGVTLEVLEGVLRVGVVDIDDVILNALGVMSGCWIGGFWKRRKAAVAVRIA
jgi:glycopeptide antibiotics resistance protein